MNRDLDLGIGVLHSERGAVATQAAVSFDVLPGEPTGINLNGNLGIRREIEN
jgi:hypothetical protein